MSASLRPVLVRLVATQVCIHACMTGFRMAAPLMALRQGHSPAAVGGLMALFALTQVFLALPAGRFTDRQGLKTPIRIAVLLASAGSALAVAWPVFGVLCVTALACGAASGLALIALQRHVGLLAAGPSQLRQVFSWMAVGPSVSNFVGPLLAGVLIDAGGFRLAYLALALLPALAWWCVQGATEHPRRGAGDALASGSSWDLLREPGFRRLLGVNWLLSSCWDVHTLLVPVLGNARGLSATAVGSLLGGFALAATGVRLLMPWLAARRAEGQVVGSAMVGTAMLFGLYPLASHYPAMLVLSVCLGVTLGCVQPMIMSCLHQITPRHRHGEALALRAMAINGSSVVMPLMFGALGAWVGVGWVFWGVGALVGGGSRYAWNLHPDADKSGQA